MTVQAKENSGPRLLKRYLTEVVPKLKEQFQYRNPMQVPRLEKIVLNMGVGKAVENRARIDGAAKDLATISGQKPVVTKARKSIAGFKLRRNDPVGCMVTLRRDRMYEFLDRLISIAIPRIRDFRGAPRDSFDGRGSYSMGIAEQFVFPEINIDKVEFVQGLHITIVTTARTDEEGFALLAELGMPFRRA